MAPKAKDLYSSKWLMTLVGAALLLIIVVGMIRELTERWRPGGPWTLHGG